MIQMANNPEEMLTESLHNKQLLSMLLELKSHMVILQGRIEEYSKHYVTQRKLEDMKYEITNYMDEEVEKVYNFIDETAQEINECISNINRDVQDELMNINAELTALKGKTHAPKKIIDKYCSLTLDNLLEEAVAYYKDNDIETSDIVEVIKLMLHSAKYILSDEFKNNKIDLKDTQFKFKELASPESITRNDVLLEVFNIDNSLSLI